MTVAYSELTRVLPWSLRALRYPFGVADRASHIVATAAAMAPEILDQISRGKDRAAGSARFGETDAGLDIDAGGLSLLEVGPATMDLLGARAPQTGCLRCAIRGSTDPELIPAILLVGADYGLTCLAIVTDPQGKSWTLETNDGTPKIVRGADLSSLEAALASAAPDLVAAARAAWSAALATDELVLLATRHAIALPPELDRVEIVDAKESVARAHRHGMPIAPETLSAIYDLEKRTWAPSSERSRAQAGFQQSSGGTAQ
ncbi:hypothetical protein [Azospirillum canadense]|uniref:hypothetical protein n=1 Tax=Azospirillum canadense TaxID=403962 RepID=UPI002226DA24|nr:hypothetical protein [Azospirillum canadense]MCW2242346.1 hypothetical protein [Azospirillum canadense]